MCGVNQVDSRSISLALSLSKSSPLSLLVILTSSPAWEADGLSCVRLHLGDGVSWCSP